MEEQYKTVLAEQAREINFRGVNWRVLAFFALLVFMAASPIFAQSGGSETVEVLDNFSTKILGVLNSTWLKVVLVIALIGEALGIVVGGQQGGGQTVKKLMPWVIGTILILCATGIVNFFFNGNSIEAPQ